MKKGQELTGKVTDVIFPNKALVETEDGPVSAKNGIPGDVVKVRITKVRKGKPEANIIGEHNRHRGKVARVHQGTMPSL